MSPGCSMSNHHSTTTTTTTTSMLTSYNNSPNCYSNELLLVSCYDPLFLDQIPLPQTTTKTTITTTTLDTFEILEQTIIKQKRLQQQHGRNRNTDMRVKILLKRTFNLVCEMMDKENGFRDDEVTAATATATAENESNMDGMEEEETLIINLSETECLDDLGNCGQEEEHKELQFIELENFNYENLLEDNNNNNNNQEAGEKEDLQELLVEKKSYYLFNDLTNNKKRCFNYNNSDDDDDDDSIGVAIKKFKESSNNCFFNIVS